jgi:hypothetical protein
VAVCPLATVSLLPGAGRRTVIRPTQVICHTMGSTLGRAEAYFRRGRAGGESHFGIRLDGRIVQWLDTEVRADAAHRANLRPDGTGAVSITTEGHSAQPWTDAQLDALVRLHQWLIRTHRGIGRRICRSGADPGLGHHVLLGSPGPWTPNIRSCPGPQRVAQWQQTVVPRVLAPFGGPDEAPAPVRYVPPPPPPRTAPAEPVRDRELGQLPLRSAESEHQAAPAPPAPTRPSEPPRAAQHRVRDAVRDFFLPDLADRRHRQ